MHTGPFALILVKVSKLTDQHSRAMLLPEKINGFQQAQSIRCKILIKSPHRFAHIESKCKPHCKLCSVILHPYYADVHEALRLSP